jgi:hypothetical protein
VISNSLSYALILAAAAVLTSDVASAQTAKLTVGKNVQVTQAQPTTPHYEAWASADPVHPGRMIACSHAHHQDPPKISQHCYVTFDGGVTWKTSIEFDKSWLNGDPATTYGRGDTVFVGVLGGGDSTEEGTRVYRSPDGGKTWEMNPQKLPFMDREYLSIDRTGKFPGRLYMHGTGSARGIDEGGRATGVRLYHSTDGGKTWKGPVERFFLGGPGLGAENSNVVMSDGTFVAFFGVTKQGRSQQITDAERDLPPNAELYIVTSTDGGETLDLPIKITDWRMDRGRSEGAVLGQIGVDLSPSPYKDRLYVTYVENVDGRLQIRFAYSADKGKTWSTPVTINDDPTPAKGAGPTDQILPAVAVNRDGVVMVSWYDRRETPDGSGWRIRATASLDGGETWSPSTIVSDKPHALTAKSLFDLMPYEGPAKAAGPGKPITLGISLNDFLYAGGHTTGLVADADGVFHPVWIDNRTGVSQIWTAPVRVTGTVVKNGSADLASLDDVSEKIGLKIMASQLDQSSNIVTVKLQLKNVSKDTVRGPFKARIVGLTSKFGTPSVLNAQNALTGPGASWDLSSLVPTGILLPDSTSKAFEMKFSLINRIPVRDGREAPMNVIDSKVRIFATAPPKKN